MGKLQLWKVSPTVTNDTYLRMTKLKYYKFQVSIIIIITIIKYISSIYWDCTRFPRPMTERLFANNYDIIMCALSLLIRQFQKEENIFAAQCIRWLASIIQYMEILRFLLGYQTYPSEYIRNWIVTPLPNQDNEGTIIPVSDIPALDLNSNFNTDRLSSQEEISFNYPIRRQISLNATQSGRVFKNEPKCWEPTMLELEQRFGKRSEKQRRRTRDRLQAEYKDTPN